MTPRKRKLWSRVVEEAGITVRLYEREPGGRVYRDVWTGEGTRKRMSLGHADRKLADTQARALARTLADLQHAGHTGAVTFGQLAALFRQHRIPLLTPTRQRTVRGQLTLLERHVARERVVDELSQHDIDAYVVARRTGALESAAKKGERPGVGDGTIRNELTLLLMVLRWGLTFRVSGRRLLAVNPLHGATLPREKNIKRPIATEARYQALVAVADRAEPSGRFRLVLALARFTGRRVNALVHLRASDVLLSREQIIVALAALGAPLAWADQWPHGALRWRAAHDKRGHDDITPLSTAARAALDAYLRAHPCAGDVPLVPSRADPTRVCGKASAGYWMRRAERLAKLPKLARGEWHTLRRLWATERRHLPVQDVAAAGGWKSLAVLRSVYQHADAAGMLAVLEPPESRPKPRRRGTQTAQRRAK